MQSLLNEIARRESLLFFSLSLSHISTPDSRPRNRDLECHMPIPTRKPRHLSLPLSPRHKRTPAHAPADRAPSSPVPAPTSIRASSSLAPQAPFNQDNARETARYLHRFSIIYTYTSTDISTDTQTTTDALRSVSRNCTSHLALSRQQTQGVEPQTRRRKKSTVKPQK